MKSTDSLDEWYKLVEGTFGLSVTVGDLVALPHHRGIVTGVVVDDTCETGWADVLLETGELVKWPTVQLRVVKNGSR